jgi:hypothetical protein
VHFLSASVHYEFSKEYLFDLEIRRKICQIVNENSCNFGLLVIYLFFLLNILEDVRKIC